MAEFKEWLKNNPISGIYTFNASIEEDVGDYFGVYDDFFEIESLGSFIFNNEFQQSAPTYVTYLLKEG